MERFIAGISGGFCHVPREPFTNRPIHHRATLLVRTNRIDSGKSARHKPAGGKQAQTSGAERSSERTSRKVNKMQGVVLKSASACNISSRSIINFTFFPIRLWKRLRDDAQIPDRSDKIHLFFLFSSSFEGIKEVWVA
jgi:hypothetical protein